MAHPLLYNSITVNIPKNMIQYFIGLILYAVIIGFPDIYVSLLGVVSFVITYSSVYLLNDIVDADEDRKIKNKSVWKPVASGTLSKKNAFSIAWILLIVGLVLSMFVNKWFFLLNALLILLNFLHSSPYTQFKKSLPKTAVNMTMIEFIKFSLGWFALTPNLEYFPFWIILGLAGAYNIGYLFYKFRLNRKLIRKNMLPIAALGILTFVSYVISWIIYDFQLSLILIFVLPLAVLVLLNIKKIYKETFKGMFFIEYVLLSLIIVSFVVLLIPAGFSVNVEINKIHTESMNELERNIPITEELKNLSEQTKRFESLDDIGYEICEEFKDILCTSQCDTYCEDLERLNFFRNVFT
jgi:heme O synthase-like polyprenyltransferase